MSEQQGGMSFESNDEIQAWFNLLVNIAGNMAQTGKVDMSAALADCDTAIKGIRQRAQGLMLRQKITTAGQVGGGPRPN